MGERITEGEVDAAVGHTARYRLASGWVEPGDTVLDAACGIGYGRRLLHADRYVGVDIADVNPTIRADLCAWVPDFDFDVAVSFETLEHVKEPAAVVATLCRARRRVVCSVPIVPTMHENPWHLWDFTVDDVPAMFAVHGWRVEQMFLQPSERSAVYVLRP